MTLAKPVPADSNSTYIKVRIAGSTQTEQRRRAQMATYADAFNIILTDRGTMHMGEAAIQLSNDNPGFKRDKGKLTSKQFLELFPNMCATHTSAVGGVIRVYLERLRS